MSFSMYFKTPFPQILKKFLVVKNFIKKLKAVINSLQCFGQFKRKRMNIDLNVLSDICQK